MRDSLAPHSTISHYRVSRRLGCGGMGEVYLAEDLKLGRQVALKLLRPRDQGFDERLRRFETEARAVSALNHPNILTIHEVIHEEDKHLIVTEYVKGSTLRQRLEGAAMRPKAAVDLAVQIAEALAAAHDAGIVHRDVKPENVMIRPDGYVKVLDFGLAKLGREPTFPNDSQSPTFARLDTSPGVIIGSFNYMSPEQARGLDVDCRTDIFSLGTVIHEMLTGRSPFSEKSPSDVLAAILHRDAVPLRLVAAETPAELERIVGTALQKNREKRYQVMKDMLLDLRGLKKSLDGMTETKARMEAAPLVTEAPPASKRKRRHDSSGRRRRSTRTIDSLAVLPLANQSADPNSEYLSEGITETVISRLSQLPKLKVMSWSAVMRYQGVHTDAQQVGIELGVRVVLTGRVLQLGDALRISLELVDVDNGWQLWGARFDRKLADIFEIQDEIANEVAERLRLKLSREEKKKLSKRSTGNVEAYQEYLRGRYSWNRRTSDGLRKSITYFEKAIEVDPSYGIAYAGLADSFAILGMAEYGAMAPPEAMPKARAAASRALELDPTVVGQAQTTLAHVTGFYDWDWTEAEKHFKRAAELQPSYPFSHHWYALLLAALERHEEALVEERRALELDPLSLIINKNVGTIHYYAGRPNQAIEQYRKTLELAPDFVRTHYFLSLACLAVARFEDAVHEVGRAIELSEDNAVFLGTLGHALARARREKEAMDVLTKLRERSQRSYVPPLTLALVLIGLGRTDEAFEQLELAFAERSSWLVSLNVEPLFDSIRDDARFPLLAKRVGLPDRR